MMTLVSVNKKCINAISQQTNATGGKIKKYFNHRFSRTVFINAFFKKIAPRKLTMNNTIMNCHVVNKVIIV